jgi:hypothetical protein
MANRKLVDVVIRAKDFASAKITKLRASLNSLSTVTKFSLAIGLAALKKSFDAVTKAASIEEDAIVGLTQALKNNNELAKENVNALLEQASALQKVTKFGNEETIALQQELATYGMLTEEIQKNIPLVLDLAAAKKIDLVTASQLVGKAFKGETGSLSRYGIVLEEGLSKTEKFIAVQKLLTEQFGGAAQAQVNTYSGAIKQASNSFGDLLESIGFYITKSERARRYINLWKFGFEEITRWIDRSTNRQEKLNKTIDENVKSIRAQINASTGYLKIQKLNILALELFDKRQEAIGKARLARVNRLGGQEIRIIQEQIDAYGNELTRINKLRDKLLKSYVKGLKSTQEDEKKVKDASIKAEDERNQKLQASISFRNKLIRQRVEQEKQAREKADADFRRSIEFRNSLIRQRVEQEKQAREEREQAVINATNLEISELEKRVTAEIAARERLLNSLNALQEKQAREALTNEDSNWAERKELLAEYEERAAQLAKELASGAINSAQDLEKITQELEKISKVTAGVEGAERVKEAVKEGTDEAAKLVEILGRATIDISFDETRIINLAKSIGVKARQEIERELKKIQADINVNVKTTGWQPGG